MRLRTLALYLIGNREAILAIASSRNAVWIGLLFVLSAGLAREYDAADLSKTPWMVLVPVAVSVPASVLLFLVACGRLYFGKHAGPRPAGIDAYRSFLALFWMTAPLAWLYAIPYERFLAPVDATQLNLLTLAVVATWRVILIARVIAVVTGRTMLASFFLVMIFASGAAFAAAAVVPPVEIVSFMGGGRVPPVTEEERAVSRGIDPAHVPPPAGVSRLSDRDRLIRETAAAIRVFGFCSAPLWLFGGLIAFIASKPVWAVSRVGAEAHSISRGVWGLAAASVLVWLPLLLWVQSR